MSKYTVAAQSVLWERKRITVVSEQRLFTYLPCVVGYKSNTGTWFCKVNHRRDAHLFACVAIHPPRCVYFHGHTRSRKLPRSSLFSLLTTVQSETKKVRMPDDRRSLRFSGDAVNTLNHRAAVNRFCFPVSTDAAFAHHCRGVVCFRRSKEMISMAANHRRQIGFGSVPHASSFRLGRSFARSVAVKSATACVASPLAAGGLKAYFLCRSS